MAVTLVLEPLEADSKNYYLQSRREEKDNSIKTRSSSTDVEKSQSTWYRRNLKKQLEIFLLASVIIAVCSLFLTPTILYALPPLRLVPVPVSLIS